VGHQTPLGPAAGSYGAPNIMMSSTNGDPVPSLSCGPGSHQPIEGFQHQVGGSGQYAVPSTVIQLPYPALVPVTSPGCPAPSAAETFVARPPRSHVKLMSFNGTGSLETFLAKFENMARYLEWNEADRYYHLCACLEGTAGQVLWDAGPQATTQCHQPLAYAFRQ